MKHLQFVVLTTILLATQRVAGQDLPQLYAAVTRDTAVDEIALDGCLRLHHVWKRQIQAAHETASLPPEQRAGRMLDLAYRPFAGFWKGYVGDEAAFLRVSARMNLATNTRARVPLESDIGALLLNATRSEIEASGKRACADWYLVFGSGVTNLGGLAGGTMLVDFMGLPRTDPVENVRLILPHELNHISFGAGHSGDPDNGTLLSSIIAEGFASWYADRFWGDQVSAAQALGYSEEQWQWALAHERELWAAAQPLLASRERATLDRFRSASARVLAEGPPKIGYFLGYRIVAAYVQRHGESSWQALFDLPLARTLRESGYAAER